VGGSVPLAITLSRQLGSGASTIGKRLAERLGMVYVDREILERASRDLNVPEDLLAEREETVTPFWQTLMASSACGVPEMMYAPPAFYPPTDHEVYLAQSKVIVEVARQQSAGIVGRGGVHVLKDHPRHLSVFLHADPAWRLPRVQQAYGVTEQEARDAIEDCDKARARYHRMVASRDWYDTRQYHLCLDTGVLGIEAATEAILAAAATITG